MTTPEQTSVSELEVQELTDDNIEEVSGGQILMTTASLDKELDGISGEVAQLLG